MRQGISTKEPNLTNNFDVVSGLEKHSSSNKTKSKKPPPRITLRLSEEESKIIATHNFQSQIPGRFIFPISLTP